MKRRLKVTVEVEEFRQELDGTPALYIRALGKRPKKHGDIFGEGVCGSMRVQGPVDSKRYGLRAGQVEEIGVKPSAQRRGVATRLYETAARETCARWSVPLVSDVARSAQADAFWKKQEKKGRAVKVPVDNVWAAARDADLSGTRRKRSRR